MAGPPPRPRAFLIKQGDVDTQLPAEPLNRALLRLRRVPGGQRRQHEFAGKIEQPRCGGGLPARCARTTR